MTPLFRSFRTPLIIFCALSLTLTAEARGGRGARTPMRQRGTLAANAGAGALKGSRLRRHQRGRRVWVPEHYKITNGVRRKVPGHWRPAYSLQQASVGPFGAEQGRRGKGSTGPGPLPLR